MTGGIIMAGVPGTAWRAPSRAPSFVDDRGAATKHPVVKVAVGAYETFRLALAVAALVPKDMRSVVRMGTGWAPPKDMAELGMKLAPEKDEPRKIAPPKVGCKTPLEYSPPEPQLEERTAYEPRHRGQLGQDDPDTYLTNGARHGEPAEEYKYKVLVPPDETSPPKPVEGGPDCNPRVQIGPGREMGL